MSKRELRGLAELGSTSVHHRLRSGSSCASRSVMEGEDRVGIEETTVPQAADAQELQEKLQMAQDELELVRADLTRRLEQAQQTAAEERACLAEQLRQAQRMSETVKEEGEEQRCKALEAERQLGELARENDELRRQLHESEGRTKAEFDALRL